MSSVIFSRPIPQFQGFILTTKSRSKIAEEVASGDFQEMCFAIVRSKEVAIKFDDDAEYDRWFFDRVTVCEEEARDWNEKTRWFTIERAANWIARESRRGRGRVVLTNPKVNLREMPSFTYHKFDWIPENEAMVVYRGANGACEYIDVAGQIIDDGLVLNENAFLYARRVRWL